MGERPAPIAHDLEIIIIKPNRMRRRKIRPNQAKIIHVLDQGFAIAPDARECLNLAFTDMAMNANIMFACQIAATAQEGIGTMMRDGWGNRCADILAVPTPGADGLIHCAKRSLPSWQTKLVHARAQGIGQAIV